VSDIPIDRHVVNEFINVVYNDYTLVIFDTQKNPSRTTFTNRPV